MCEMTAVEYMKIKARLVNVDAYGECGISCDICPLSSDNNGKKVFCTYLELGYPEEAVAIIQKWAEEHPQKTRMDDFFEKFPNAKRRTDGTPYSCPIALGYTSEPCRNLCNECWNKPLEEAE